MLWPGTYTATYLARATTPGTFIKPPAHAEEMYNPGVNGRSDGGTFVVTREEAADDARARPGVCIARMRWAAARRRRRSLVRVDRAADSASAARARRRTGRHDRGPRRHRASLHARRRRQQRALGAVRPHRSRLINAFVAVEDRRFWDHHGIDAARRRRARCATTARAPHRLGRVDDHDAARATAAPGASASWSGKLAQALVGAAARGAPHQAADPRAVPQSRPARAGHGRRRGGECAVLRHVAVGGEHRAGGDARRSRACAIARQSARVARRARARGVHWRSRGCTAWASRRATRLRARRDEPLVERRSRARRSSRRTSRRACWRGPPTERDATRTARIRTSLDVGLQTELEAEVRHTVERLHDRGVGQAAVVVLDNATGEVLAWVGSPDFWASENGQTDMVVSRAPARLGAQAVSLRPRARSRRHRGDCACPTLPKSYATTIGAYRPRNYDRRFRGPVRAREALASSYNVPAVELASRVGAASLLQTLHLAGLRVARLATPSITGSASRWATAT